MWKFYLYVVFTVGLIGLSIASFILRSYWQGAGELLVGLIWLFITIGTYSDLKKIN